MPTAGGGGPPTAPIPAVISANLGDFRRQIGPGERFELVSPATATRSAASRAGAAFPGVPAGERFVVVSRAVLAEVLEVPELRAGTIFVRGADGLVDQIRAEVGGSGEVDVRHRHARRWPPRCGMPHW